MSRAPSRHCCTLCGRTYARLEHLMRHERTHTGLRAHQCSYCGRSYARGDVLKRHYKTCSKVVCPPLDEIYDDVPLRETHRTQPETRDDPSSTTTHSDVDVWPSVGLEICNPTPPTIMFAETRVPTRCSLDSMYNLGLDRALGDSLYVVDEPATTFSFLDHFTSGLNLRKAFNGGPTFENITSPTCANENLNADAAEFVDDCVQVPASQVPGPKSCRCMDVVHCDPIILPCDLCSLEGECWLQRKAAQVVRGVMQHMNQSFSYDLSVSKRWPSTRIQAFLCPQQLSKFLRYYWRYWHANLPLLHPATFNLASVPAPLLASMAILGACHSPHLSDRMESKMYYESIEHYVFAHLESFRGTPLTKQTIRQIVQALQAAYLVVVFQTWDGEPHQRPGVRRHRFGQMMETVHTLLACQLIHANHRQEAFNEFDWLAFVETEELIRILAWCFLIDSAFAIFFNIAPRLVLRELRMGLPCPESCFDATTPATCFFYLQQWQHEAGIDAYTTLYEVIRSTLVTSLDLDAQMRLACQSTITLFCIVSAIHVMLFNSDPAVSVPGQYDPIRNSLNNWRTVWNRRRLLLARVPPEHQKGAMDLQSRKFGFWQNCPDYWLLAKLFVQQIETSQVVRNHPLSVQSRTHSAPCYDEDSQRKLHEFITLYQNVNR